MPAVSGKAGYVEREPIKTTGDGRFELTLETAKSAAPFALEVSREDSNAPRLGCLIPLPALGPGRRHELGDVLFSEKTRQWT